METRMMFAKPLAEEMKARFSREVKEIKRNFGVTPKLVALLIGDDPVSRTYVDLKRKDCEEVGITSEVIDLSHFSKDESSKKVLEKIKELNDDASVNAVIPQMPFSGKISEEVLFSVLSPDKDADGLTPYRLGKLLRSEYKIEDSLLPCTPKGAILLSKYYEIPIVGADVAIVGRSTLVGEPLRKLFQDLNATATCYHTSSRHLGEKLSQADIVVAASGRPPELYGSSGFRLSAENVKPGSSVISIGVRKDEATGRMLFDVDTASIKSKCANVTPNTGGVGVMTRICLLQNTLTATRNQLGR
ncbi:MAG: bifunctional 5,10-methylenetetrahydrofolate dehydrogenase/5,10-methenyltetrahydrofolate cyclohydrolase [Nitrososphaerota archaeon]|nr:bifunctional 5,10-methylenetetrahydrofolate dehydrogenase/5,10-methenyltetrahydrofolate cyclohydrolase [Nitrososphaerota archaeon]